MIIVHPHRHHQQHPHEHRRPDERPPARRPPEALRAAGRDNGGALWDSPGLVSDYELSGGRGSAGQQLHRSGNDTCGAGNFWRPAPGELWVRTRLPLTFPPLTDSLNVRLVQSNWSRFLIPKHLESHRSWVYTTTGLCHTRWRLILNSDKSVTPRARQRN